MRRIVALSLLLLAGGAICSAIGQQVEIIVPIEANQNQQQQQLSPPVNYPFYVQSPLSESQALQEPLLKEANIPIVVNEQQQRSQVAGAPRRLHKLVERPRSSSGSRKLQPQEQVANLSQFGNNELLGQANILAAGKQPEPSNCLYEKRYLAQLDECLTRKPYPTIGLPAFRNEDLLLKRNLNERHGCQFVLNNGLFRNYQITRFAVDADNQCLDNTKVGLLLTFSNVSMAYLWNLRCLNRADQLLDDSSLEGADLVDGSDQSSRKLEGGQPADKSICVGSSQNFGFASLQLNGLEAQVELFSDIYKNWRVTNITVAMSSPQPLPQPQPQPPLAASGARSANIPEPSQPEEQPLVAGDNIKDYTFETLDGDELNWRYLHLFRNWSRNKMYTNFLEQYRRFLWISIQRCLAESSERLPVKLNDIFAPHRF